MFYYIDESGNTGVQHFDASQKNLYYGVLESKIHLDHISSKYISEIKLAYPNNKLHANKLRNDGLLKISDSLLKLQKQFKLKFDIYKINKPDHSIIMFFECVFDQGINPKVPWDCYWTPLRYRLLLTLASLFNVESMSKAWDARIEKSDDKCKILLNEVLEYLIVNCGNIEHDKERDIMTKSLTWAKINIDKLNYNAKNKGEIFRIAPNIIGFQGAMSLIATRSRIYNRQPKKIIVDIQAQFNPSQKSAANTLDLYRNVPAYNGPGLPEDDFIDMPDPSLIEFKSSDDSFGLQLVDIFLWIYKRFSENQKLAPKLTRHIDYNKNRGLFDQISLESICRRWSKWFESKLKKDV